MLFKSPRIRLTKVDKSRVIIPVDAITAIEECRQMKCTRVYTLDGFWYEVVNEIVEIDKKIDDAIFRSNKSEQNIVKENPHSPSIVSYSNINVPPTLPQQENTSHAAANEPNVTDSATGDSKTAKVKRRKSMSAGIEKPARGDTQGQQAQAIAEESKVVEKPVAAIQENSANAEQSQSK